MPLEPKVTSHRSLWVVLHPPTGTAPWRGHYLVNWNIFFLSSSSVIPPEGWVAGMDGM